MNSSVILTPKEVAKLDPVIRGKICFLILAIPAPDEVAVAPDEVAIPAPDEVAISSLLRFLLSIVLEVFYVRTWGSHAILLLTLLSL